MTAHLLQYHRKSSYKMDVLVSLLLSTIHSCSLSTAFVSHLPSAIPQCESRHLRHGTTTNLILKASALDLDISNENNGNDEEIGAVDAAGRITSLLSNAVTGAATAAVDSSLPAAMLELPRHSHNDGVNKILMETEHLIQSMNKDSEVVDPKSIKRSMAPTAHANGQGDDAVQQHDAIFANTYVDLGKVDTVGFDYDYTLVHYTDELLELLYEMALTRLVNDRHYPLEMLESGLRYDPFFSIRGE